MNSRESRAGKKLTPKALNQFNSNSIMPSQIQVTSWREDCPGVTSSTTATTAASHGHHSNCAKPASGNRGGAKNANNHQQSNTKQSDATMNSTSGRRSKGDGSIAERIVNAARAATTKKN